VTAIDGSYSYSVPAGTNSATGAKTNYNPQTISNFTVIANQTTVVNFILQGQSPGNVTGLTADAGNTTIALEWNNPSASMYSGTRLVFKVGSPPGGPTDAGATLLIDDAAPAGSHRTYTHNNVANGQNYYYAAYTYFQDANRYYASGVTISAVAALRCDFNRDGDVDMGDFGHLQVCLTGANIAITDPNCISSDLDQTGTPDVDTADLNLLLDCMAGPDVYANPACLP
jgi:hypothetical protein